MKHFREVAPAGLDVTGRVDVTDPEAVLAEVRAVLSGVAPAFDEATAAVLVDDLTRLYRGEFPGFNACDVRYHNLQHVLDVTLAMARLLAGHERSHDEGERLGAENLLLGLTCSLFHDSGYITRLGEEVPNGAVYTRIHVSRSAHFLTDYLPTVGLADFVPLCQRIVHFTGYEIHPEAIATESESERTLGRLLGTADLIAQMSDRNYLQKCHDYLYQEFEAGGIAGPAGANPDCRFHSPRHLLETTPNFMDDVIAERLEGYFEAAYHYAEAYFGDGNPYMDAIRRNYETLRAHLRNG